VFRFPRARYSIRKDNDDQARLDRDLSDDRRTSRDVPEVHWFAISSI
jgi:hypothetical protein